MIVPKTKSNSTGRVVPHQDGWVSFTDPTTCITFWYALEDTTVDNGCLLVAAGSHLKEGIKTRATIHPDGRPEEQLLAKPVFPKEVDPETALRSPRCDHTYTPLEVKAGTLILMHGNLVHKSEPNRTKQTRMAFVFSIIEGCPDCWADSCLRSSDGTNFESLSRE